MAGRRMRIKGMANIPSLNRGRSSGVGSGDTDKLIVPRSPAPADTEKSFDPRGPGSPFAFDRPHSPSPWSPSSTHLGSTEELIQPKFLRIYHGTVPPTMPIDRRPHSPSARSPSPAHLGSAEELMPSPKSPGGFNYNRTVSRPNSPLKSPARGNIFSPPSTPGSSVAGHNRPVSRPSSPLKSPSRGNIFSPPSSPGPGSFVAGHEHLTSYEQPKRAGSPAIHGGYGNYGTMPPNTAERDSGNTAISSSETLRQRLQKGTSLNTSKYSTTRKEFLIKYTDKKPDLSELKILHYTFWNPPNDRKGRRKSSMLDNDEEDLFIGSSDFDNPFAGLPDEAFNSRNIGGNDNSKAPDSEEKGSHVNNKTLTPAVGPRVKVGPNGELIIDEQSLVVETSEAQRAKKHLEEIETVSGAGYEVGSSGFYRHKRNPRRGGDWTSKETVKFYRALSSCGTDFSMMAHLFPKRSRAELKSKFKREDRRNPGQISQALSCQTFDPMDKMTSSEEEEEDFCIPPPKKSRRRNDFPSTRKDSKKLAEIRLALEPDTPASTPPISVPSKIINDSDVQSSNSSNLKPVTSKQKKPKRKPKTVRSVPGLVEEIQQPGNFNSRTKQVGISVEEFLMNNPIDEYIIPDTPQRTLIAKITKEKSSNDSIVEGWTPPPQPQYGSNAKPKFTKGRPRRVFDKNVKRLEKEAPPILPEIKNPVKTTRSRKPKSKRNKQAIPESSLGESEKANNSETISKHVLVQPEILRFDPSDPLGFNVIPSTSSNVVTNDAEIVLDAPNRGTIPHQVFDIQSISPNQSLSSSEQDQPSGTLSANLTEPFNDENIKVNKRSLRVKPTPRAPRYRVPGPGGKANITSSSVVDEIEIEITCL